MFRGILLPAVAASVLIAAPAFAQAPAPVAPPAPYQHGQAGPGHRLQELHDQLGITPAQQPQWDALVATLRDDARAMRGNPAVQALRTRDVSGLARLRAVADASRARADAMQRLVPVVEALYGVLTPQQQQIADREIDHALHPRAEHRG